MEMEYNSIPVVMKITSCYKEMLEDKEEMVDRLQMELVEKDLDLAAVRSDLFFAQCKIEKLERINRELQEAAPQPVEVKPKKGVVVFFMKPQVGCTVKFFLRYSEAKDSWMTNLQRILARMSDEFYPAVVCFGGVGLNGIYKDLKERSGVSASVIRNTGLSLPIDSIDHFITEVCSGDWNTRFATCIRVGDRYTLTYNRRLIKEAGESDESITNILGYLF